MSPSLAQLVRHAELFGTECVYESAGPKVNLTRLRIELDRIEAARKNGRYTVGRRRRRGEDETRSMVAVLRDEGLVDRAIANRLGISLQRVRRLAKTGPQTRMVERRKLSRNGNLVPDPRTAA